MTQVVTFQDYAPPARYDDIPWAEVRVMEAPTSAGSWTLIDTLDLSPLDSDPSHPQSRSFTTSLASNTPGLWYCVVFVDGSGNVSLQTDAVQNPIEGVGLYVERDDIKNTQSISGSFTDADIDRALVAACRGIDLATHHPYGFYPGTPGEIRYYKPQAADKIVIDDLISVDALWTSQFGNNIFDRQWTPEVTFVLTPLNAASYGRPYTRIEINPWAAFVGFPFWAPRSAQLTGQFGWPSTPAGIVEAAALLTTRLLQRAKTAPLGVVFNVDVATRIAYSDPDVKDLIHPFHREELL